MTPATGVRPVLAAVVGATVAVLLVRIIVEMAGAAAPDEPLPLRWARSAAGHGPRTALGAFLLLLGLLPEPGERSDPPAGPPQAPSRGSFAASAMPNPGRGWVDRPKSL